MVGRVSSTTWGDIENPEWLIVLVLAQLGRVQQLTGPRFRAIFLDR